MKLAEGQIAGGLHRRQFKLSNNFVAAGLTSAVDTQVV